MQTMEKHDGKPWKVLGLYLVIEFVIAYLLYHESITVIEAIISMFIVLLLASQSIVVLEPNEEGVYIFINKFTKKFTSKGGIKGKIPFLQQITKFEMGMFSIKVKYENLTLDRGDNISGHVILTVDLKYSFIETLYGITGRNLNREVIIKKCTELLEERVPSDMALALEKYAQEEGKDSIDEGSEFEIIIKTKKYREILKKFLSRYIFDNDEEYEEGMAEEDRWRDCFGLELKKVEIPTPVITGELYDNFRKTEATKGGQKLATELAKEFGVYFKQYVDDYKTQTDSTHLDGGILAQLRSEALKLFGAEKGIDVRMYDGLNNQNTIIT